jgi:diaminohydroxyphosphoribosylaminopyrimidine deaminase/5-amino-6-(5-phosphoribosylamino)uracil reductase
MSTQTTLSIFMELALSEAKKSLGRTSPNPAVGAVIVKEGMVVGKGYHHKAGAAHAEVNALLDAGEQARDATLYVTLEPCHHSGKTPPCTEAILRAGIRKVVIGMLDPNPRVVGGGAEYLCAQGLEVVSGLLEEQCKAINFPFIKHSSTGLPWIILKAGLSLDGKITLRPRRGDAITGIDANRYVHQVRNQVDALLIGVETALIDDPQLTTRLEGEPSRDPLRIVLDSSLRLPVDARMLTQQSDAATWVICGEQASSEKEARLLAAGAQVVRVPLSAEGRIDLVALLAFLGQRDICSILVEGGSRIHGAFCRQHLVDEFSLLYAPFIVGDAGTPLVSGYCLENREAAPVLRILASRSIGRDVLLRFLVER